VSGGECPEQPTYIARWAIWDALEGEPRLLAERVREGIASPEERALAADLISRKIKPRRIRKGQPPRSVKQAMVQMVFTMEAAVPPRQRKEIIPFVAKAFSVSKAKPLSVKTVYNALAECEELGAIVRTADLRAVNEESFKHWLEQILGPDDSAAASE
jgi:hypothetical protein